MEAHVTGTTRSPAQLYALIFGAVLTVAGIIGFFYNSDFTSDKSVRDAVFGILDVNGWHNLVHILTGIIGLVVASSYSGSRSYALGFGFIYIIVAVWGFIIGSGDSILSIVPVNTEDNFLHLLIGFAGIAAGMATPAVADPTTTRPATT
jgi:NAD/NADP transhydrogenase beta subunit